MSWKYVEKPKTMLVGKSLVREFAEMEPAPYDRPLSERRLQVYERILRAGEFRPVTWASAVCAETNCVYRVNGKHTSTLLIKQDPLPEFYVTVERYRCDRLSDVADLYNTFDSRLGARSTTDINLAFASTIRDLDQVAKRFVHLTVTAAANHKWGEKAKEMSPAERAEELVDAYPFAVWMAGVCGSSGAPRASAAGHLVRQPVANAMYATYQRSRAKAEEFWLLVKDESAPDRDDPSRVLARYLVRAVVAGGNSGAGGDGRRIAGGSPAPGRCTSSASTPGTPGGRASGRP